MINYDPKFMGKRIRKLRENSNMTREELAYALNISDSYIGLLERGTRGITINNLVKIANFFNVSINYFFNEDNKYLTSHRLQYISSIIDSLDEENYDFILKVIEDFVKHIKKTQS